MIVSIINKKSYNRVASTRRIFFFAVLIMIPLSLMGWTLSLQEGKGSMAVSEAGLKTGEFIRSLYFICDKAFNAERFSNPFNWINLLFLGLVASGLCFTSWNKVCQIVGTVKVSCTIKSIIAASYPAKKASYQKLYCQQKPHILHSS